VQVFSFMPATFYEYWVAESTQDQLPVSAILVSDKPV